MGIKGRVHRFYDNISTDDIIAGKYKNRILDLSELATHAMENLDPEFYSRFTPGDFVVAGSNFGIGSSRETAALVLRQIGCSAVLAKSYARIFYRNSFNVGLRLIECDAEGIQEGDLLTVDLDAGKVHDEQSGLSICFKAPPAFMSKVFEEGGLVAHFKKHGRFAFTE